MTPVIPVECCEIEQSPGSLVTQIKFTIPSLRRELIAEFIPSRTSAAIRRLMRVIDLETAGAPVNEVVDALEKFLKPAKRAKNATLSDFEVLQFKRANGWEVEPAEEPAAPVEPAPVEPAEERAAPPAPAEERAPMVTSDGRYTVDPVARTVEPVEDIPADIVAVMPVWEVHPTCVEFWPRTFDIPGDLVAAFEVEQATAAAVLAEVAAHILGVEPAALQLAQTGNCAELAAAEVGA